MGLWAIDQIQWLSRRDQRNGQWSSKQYPLFLLVHAPLVAPRSLVGLARGMSEEQWEELERKPKYEVKTQERQRPENVKERIVRERGYKNIRTVSEQVAEFAYRPGKCTKTYRMVVLRKNLTVEKGGGGLFDEIH